MGKNEKRIVDSEGFFVFGSILPIGLANDIGTHRKGKKRYNAFCRFPSITSSFVWIDYSSLRLKCVLPASTHQQRPLNQLLHHSIRYP